MKYTAIVVFTMISAIGTAQSVILNESFNSGIPASWTTIDNDGLTPDNANFTAAWISYDNPDDATDKVAASTSYYNPAGTASDYLISPLLPLGNFGNILTWKARSVDLSYLEDYHVLISTTDKQVSSFTDTLYSSLETPADWDSVRINLEDHGYVNQSVYIAFVNATNDGYVLLVNDVKCTSNDASNIQTLNKTNLKLYPNPASSYGSVNIQLENNIKINQIQLITIGGQVIRNTFLNTSVSNYQLPLNNAAKGFYTMVIYTSEGMITRKLIVD